MLLKKEDIIESISKMNMMELIELTKLMEEKFNLSIDNTKISKEKNITIETEKVEEKKFFSIIMKNHGENKLNVIKTIRIILNLGLKESKDFVENLPATIKENSSKEEAEKIKKQLEDAGAIIELK